MNILVTGGAGYIGTHTIVALIQAGHDVVVIDNFSNSHPEALRRVEKITQSTITSYNLDLCHEHEIEKVFLHHTFDAVIHFAGLKSVGQSVAQPLDYYSNNLVSTLTLLKIMQKHEVKKIIFSSSATVYGTPEELPLKETSRTGTGITNPYGQTKYMIEQILHDLGASDTTFEITILRYFNPVGAHESGLIGENPSGVPNNLLPYIAQVAAGKREIVNVYGDDYDTIDGTGVRDYIHISDLATGHIAALEHATAGVATYNLGTGEGVTVLELIAAFRRASGKTIPYQVLRRRPGDIDSCYASPVAANQDLNWHASKTIDDACVDTWRWQSQNPNGF